MLRCSGLLASAVPSLFGLEEEGWNRIDRKLGEHSSSRITDGEGDLL